MADPGGEVVPLREPGQDEEPSVLTERERLEALAATSLAQGRYKDCQQQLHRLQQMETSGIFERPLRGPEIFAPLPPIKWVLQRLEIAPGAPAMFAGYGFSGKTLAAMSMALSIAAGLEVWGELEATQGPVLHLDYEQGDWLSRRRYQRLARGLEICEPEQLPLELLVFPGLQLLDECEDSWCRICDGKILVIVDSYRAAARHIDENSSVARQPLDLLGRVSQRTGATLLVIHHARKASRDAAGGAAQSVRGSGALYDALQSCVVFAGEKGVPPVVKHEKARVTGQLAEDFALQIEDVGWQEDPRWGLMVRVADIEQLQRQAADERSQQLDDAMVAFVRSNPDCTTRELRGGVKGSSQAIDAARDRLERLGRLQNTGDYRGAKWRVKA